MKIKFFSKQCQVLKTSLSKYLKNRYKQSINSIDLIKFNKVYKQIKY